MPQTHEKLGINEKMCPKISPTISVFSRTLSTITTVGKNIPTSEWNAAFIANTDPSCEKNRFVRYTKAT